MLTAAHYMYRGRSESKHALEPSEVVIGYGNNDRTKTTKVAVAEIFVHPNAALDETMAKGAPASTAASPSE
jgi:hypothetical protein